MTLSQSLGLFCYGFLIPRNLPFMQPASLENNTLKAINGGQRNDLCV